MRKKHNAISIVLTILSGIIFITHSLIGIFGGIDAFYVGYGRVIFIILILVMILSMLFKENYSPIDNNIPKDIKRNLLKMSNFGILFTLTGIISLYAVIVLASIGSIRYVFGCLFLFITCLGWVFLVTSDYIYSKYTS